MPVFYCRQVVLTTLCTLLPVCAMALGPLADVGWRMQANGPQNQTRLTLVTDFPATDQGQTAQQYLAALWGGALFCRGSLTWAPCSAGVTPHTQGSLPAQATLELGTLDTEALRGAQIFAGYGTSLEDMLQNARYRHVYTLGHARAIAWSIAQEVPSSSNAVLAFNNTTLAVRDATGNLHLVWADGVTGYHARHDGQSWVVNTLAKQGNGSLDKPTLALLADGELMLLWSELTAGQRTLYASRTSAGRSRWLSPLALASGDLNSAVSLTTFTRTDGSAAATVAWMDEGNNALAARAWSSSSTGWSLNEWHAANAPAATTAQPHDVGLASQGLTVWATWEDKRGGGSSEIYLTRSTDGGQTWEADRRLPLTRGSAAGGDPSAAVLPDGTVLLAYQNQSKIWMSRSTDEGKSFSAPTQIGSGLFAHLATNTRGAVAYLWEHFEGGGAFNDSSKTVGNSISLDGLVSVDGPHAMLGSEQVFYAVQAASSVAQDRIDVFWVDTSSTGQRRIYWRSGLFTD